MGPMDSEAVIVPAKGSLEFAGRANELGGHCCCTVKRDRPSSFCMARRTSSLFSPLNGQVDLLVGPMS